MEYPTLLIMEPPRVKAYSVETVVAEKFEAMIDLADSNSRMKDFYDVYRLLLTGNFSSETLKEAIFNTFQRRETGYVDNHPLFRADFAINAQRVVRWKSFLKKSGLDTSIGFEEVLRNIEQRLYPIYEALKESEH